MFLTQTIRFPLIAACWLAFAFHPFQQSMAQDEFDPFSAATTPVQNPFLKQKTQVDSNMSADFDKEAKHFREIANYREKLEQLETHFEGELALVKSRNDALKQRVNFYETKEKSNSESYRILIEQMLDSDDTRIKGFALKSLQRINHEDHHRKLGPELSESTQARIVQIAKANSPELNELAQQWLMDNMPSEAVKMGYQRPGLWHSITATPENIQIKEALHQPAYFDDEEVELEEIVDRLQDLYRFNVFAQPGVDVQTPITFKSAGAKLGTSLKHLLATCKLDYYIDDGSLAIVKKGHSEPKVTHIYRVTGLLSNQLAIEKIVSVVDEMITEQKLDGKVNAIDENRLTINGSESVQLKVAELLGQLATE